MDIIPVKEMVQMPVSYNFVLRVPYAMPVFYTDIFSVERDLGNRSTLCTVDPS